MVKQIPFTNLHKTLGSMENLSGKYQDDIQRLQNKGLRNSQLAATADFSPSEAITQWQHFYSQTFLHGLRQDSWHFDPTTFPRALVYTHSDVLGLCNVPASLYL